MGPCQSDIPQALLRRPQRNCLEINMCSDTYLEHVALAGSGSMRAAMGKHTRHCSSAERLLLVHPVLPFFVQMYLNSVQPSDSALLDPSFTAEESLNERG